MSVTYSELVGYLNSSENCSTIKRKLREMFPVTEGISAVDVQVTYYNIQVRFVNRSGMIVGMFSASIGQGFLDQPTISLGLVANNMLSSSSIRTSRSILPRDTDSNEEEYILRAFSWFAKTFQKPESRGCVKVFLDRDKYAWTWKRSSHEHVRQIEGEYFYALSDNRFVKLYSSETEFTYELRSEIEQRTDVNLVGSRYWLRSALTPIYVNSIPFEAVARYVTNPEIYEFIMVDGERRYVDVRRNQTMLADTPIHGYSTRIEQLIPVDKLFLKGKVDLYDKRSQEETPFLGWELEACTNQGASAATAFKEYMPFEVMCKSDSSISPAGFETVSIPATLDFWKESELISTLNSMRAKPHNMRSFKHSSCGFHVHVSRSALSVLDLQKMERFVHNPENKQFMEAVAGRAPNTYQNYNESLFSGRAKLVSSNREYREEEIEGLRYFGTYSDMLTYARGYNSRVGLLNFIDGYVSYDTLWEFLNSIPDDELEPFFTEGWDYVRNHVGTNVFNYLNRTLQGSSSYSRIFKCSSISERIATANTFFELLFGKLSHQSPHFAYLLFRMGLTWDGVNVVDTNPQVQQSSDSTIPEWKKKGVRKTVFSVKRKDNYAVCRSMNLGPVGKAVTGRYDVLNTTNRNTVEFRLFKGTMNPTSVMRYLEFVDALVRFVPSTSAVDEGVSFKKFVKWLVTDAFNVTRYEHLVSFLKDKNFVEPKLIRRRTLPQVEAQDNEVAGFIPPKPKGFMPENPEPIGSFSRGAAAASMMPASEIAYDPDTDDECNYIEEDTCHDCGNAYDYCVC